MNEDVVTAFSSPVRIKILKCLKEYPKNVSQLINVCKVSQSAVSQHLKKLRDAGLIRDRKEGKEVFYSLSKKKAADIAVDIEKLAKQK